MAHILILDDNPGDRLALQEFLQKNGHEVVASGDEELGFSMLADRPFDLVLLDMALPKKGGSRVLVKLVRDYPDLKILVTARSGETIATRQYLKMADDRGTVRALAKPFDGRRLGRAVDVMLNGLEWQRRDDNDE